MIWFNDSVAFDEESEHLNYFVRKDCANDKIKLLAEYYKYHSEIPRIY